ncbi:MAG: hypothetical protein IKG18_16685 [Atopobiaceae bacterium]|nr:hypothetical protein [Atopobiaceae bacterium]
MAIMIACLCMVIPCYAYLTEDHNAQIEYVLFGDGDYKSNHPKHADMIQSIEDAVYLCVDQYNGNGQDKLDYLIKERDVPDLPKSIEAIDFSGNYAHRGPTHSGWNGEHAKKCQWPVRQRILLNTVKHELFPSDATLLTWFPWAEEIVFKNEVARRGESDKQCESFCIMLYYVHILGDHIYAGDEARNNKDGELTLKQKQTGLAYIDPLTRPNDTVNPGIIPDLESCFAVLFASQEDSGLYRDLISKLDEYKQISDSLVNSKGGIDTEEEFEKYNQCSKDLLETLAEYVPEMLRKEPFFYDALYR